MDLGSGQYNAPTAAVTIEHSTVYMSHHSCTCIMMHRHTTGQPLLCCGLAAICMGADCLLIICARHRALESWRTISLSLYMHYASTCSAGSHGCPENVAASHCIMQQGRPTAQHPHDLSALDRCCALPSRASFFLLFFRPLCFACADVCTVYVMALLPASASSPRPRAAREALCHVPMQEGDVHKWRI